MRVIECEQGSPEWLAARIGRITASRIADVTAKRKRGDEEMACRASYRVELIAERLTQRTAEHFISPEMVWGTEQEKFARAAYELTTGTIVDSVGFILHPTLDCAGASPDGLIEVCAVTGKKLGGVEFKCPTTKTHIEWILAGGVPEEHQPQILWNMRCAERAWWDFVSFDPRLPDGLNIFAVRMPRDEQRIAEIEREVMRFDGEVEAVMESLMKKVLPSIREEKSIDMSTPELCRQAMMDAVCGPNDGLMLA